MQVDVASKNQNEQLVNSGADLQEKNLTSKMSNLTTNKNVKFDIFYVEFDKQMKQMSNFT